MGTDIHLSVGQPRGNPNCVAQDCNFKARGGYSLKNDLSKKTTTTKPAYLAVQVSHYIEMR